jgi:hypothetical protein
VLWRELKDAEFAETWSENVEHGPLDIHMSNGDMLKRKRWMEKMEKEADLAKEKAAKMLTKTKREAQSEKVML